MAIEPISLAAAPRRAAAKVLIDGVSKRSGPGAEAVQALKPIDIAVGAGEFLTIVGPSGMSMGFSACTASAPEPKRLETPSIRTLAAARRGAASREMGSMAIAIVGKSASKGRYCGFVTRIIATLI